MSEIGVAMDGTSMAISVEPRSEYADCVAKPRDCLKHGSLVVSSVGEVIFVGGLRVSDDVSIQVSNSKSYSSISINSSRADLRVDIVAPPKVGAPSQNARAARVDMQYLIAVCASACICESEFFLYRDGNLNPSPVSPFPAGVASQSSPVLSHQPHGQQSRAF